MASPSVVLPADSPTTPSVSPLRTAIVTPSTALMPTVRAGSAPDRKPDPQVLGPKIMGASAGSERDRASAPRPAARDRDARAVNARSTGPRSTILPSFITQTVSANLRTMPRSWVMNS